MSPSADDRAELEELDLDQQIGAAWRLDTDALYGGDRCVQRLVVHVRPNLVIVCDRAALPTVQDVSLRWHTITACEPAADGSFRLTGGTAQLAGRIVDLHEEGAPGRNRHSYATPYDRGRLGEPLGQRRDPYLELRSRTRLVEFISVFAVFAADQPVVPTWQGAPRRLGLSDGSITVRHQTDRLSIATPDSGSFYLPLQPITDSSDSN